MSTEASKILKSGTKAYEKHLLDMSNQGRNQPSSLLTRQVAFPARRHGIGFLRICDCAHSGKTRLTVREEIISAFSKEQKKGLSWSCLNYRRKSSVLCSFKDRKRFFPRKDLSADKTLPHAAGRKNQHSQTLL